MTEAPSTDLAAATKTLARITGTILTDWEYVLSKRDHTNTAKAVVIHLALADLGETAPLTLAQLVGRTQRNDRSIRRALTALIDDGIVVSRPDPQNPKRYLYELDSNEPVF